MVTAESARCRSRVSAACAFPKLVLDFNVPKTASRKAFENSGGRSGIDQIGFVTHPNAAMLPSSGWGPYRDSKEGFNACLESHQPRPLN